MPVLISISSPKRRPPISPVIPHSAMSQMGAHRAARWAGDCQDPARDDMLEGAAPVRTAAIPWARHALALLRDQKELSPDDAGKLAALIRVAGPAAQRCRRPAGTRQHPGGPARLAGHTSAWQQIQSDAWQPCEADQSSLTELPVHHLEWRNVLNEFSPPARRNPDRACTTRLRAFGGHSAV